MIEIKTVEEFNFEVKLLNEVNESKKHAHLQEIVRCCVGRAIKNCRTAFEFDDICWVFAPVRELDSEKPYAVAFLSSMLDREQYYCCADRLSLDYDIRMLTHLFTILIFKRRSMIRKERERKEREMNRSDMLLVHTFDSPFPKVLNLDDAINQEVPQQPERFGRLIFDESQSANSGNESESNEYGDPTATGGV